MTRLTSSDHARIFATGGYQDLKSLGLVEYITDEQQKRIAESNFHAAIARQVRDEVIEAHGEAAADPVAPLMETLRPLYEYLLNRRADEPGLQFWAGVLAQKEKQIGRVDALKFVIAEFTSSPGFKDETGQ